ncbi:MAG: dipicolinate synthase subunit B [Ruminococcaceae bacterium]|nr:dipicolinate synthase subunit B [Oscillospiraceae bacterium]MEE1197854.1 dipicolinate synthase subunit B [Acutalibacteraceae bacterium]
MFMPGITAGYALCGSFCTIAESVKQLEILKKNKINLIPIMSEVVYNTDNRFNKADDLRERVVGITENQIIHSITGAEPIGPKKLLDVLIVSPCTGNTLAKIANGITDSSVTMAVKAHLRNNRPVVLGIATNDALGASAVNIGKLLNTKNIYFIPFGQDDPKGKNNSLIADFDKTLETMFAALSGEQLQPILINKQ